MSRRISYWYVATGNTKDTCIGSFRDPTLPRELGTEQSKSSTVNYF